MWGGWGGSREPDKKEQLLPFPQVAGLPLGKENAESPARQEPPAGGGQQVSGGGRAEAQRTNCHFAASLRPLRNHWHTGPSQPRVTRMPESWAQEKLSPPQVRTQLTPKEPWGESQRLPHVPFHFLSSMSVPWGERAAFVCHLLPWPCSWALAGGAPGMGGREAQVRGAQRPHGSGKGKRVWGPRRWPVTGPLPAGSSQALLCPVQTLLLGSPAPENMGNSRHARVWPERGPLPCWESCLMSSGDLGTGNPLGATLGFLEPLSYSSSESPRQF